MKKRDLHPKFRGENGNDKTVVILFTLLNMCMQLVLH